MVTMKALAAAATVFLMATPALADRVNHGYVGCITKKALDEFVTAAVNSDNRQMETLIGSVCLPIGGLEYSMIDQGFITNEIRVYANGNSVAVFTPAEATR